MLLEPERFEIVRWADTPEQRRSIYEFRYQVLVHERGCVELPGIDPFNESVHTDEDEGPEVTHLYTGTASGDVVDAAARLRIWAEVAMPDPLREHYSVDRLPGADALTFADVGSILARPRSTRRDNAPVASLLRGVFEACLDADVDVLLFAVHPGLVRVVGELFGARRFGAALREDTSGLLEPMAVVLGDAKHHEQVGSLFAGAAWKHFVLGKRPCPDPDTLAEAWVDLPARDLDPDERWLDYEDRFFRQGTERWSFFEGLRPAVVEELLARGETRALGEGEALFGEGSDPLEMFVVLEGCFEVTVGERPVDVAGKGELVGEIAVLSESDERTAAVRALTPATVLALDYRVLRSLNAGDPDAGYMVMINLARFVAERFRDRVRRASRLEEELDRLRAGDGE